MSMGEAKAGGGRGLSDIIYVKLGRSIIGEAFRAQANLC
jgi:hypothetical protein